MKAISTELDISRAQIEDFLYHEAALLDAWRLDEWMALLTATMTPTSASTPSVASTPPVARCRFDGRAQVVRGAAVTPSAISSTCLPHNWYEFFIEKRLWIKAILNQRRV